jgi:hypothetical protein
MTRNHVRAALLQVRGNRDVEHCIGAVHEAVDTAAGRDVENRITRRHEQLAGDEHVGAAEVHEDVAVTVRSRYVVQKDRFAVEVEIAPRLEEGVERHLGHGPVLGRHAREHVLVRDDRRRIAVDRHAGLRDGLVAARMLAVRARVDDPADRRVRDLANRGQHGLARRRRPRVDDENAVRADLHGDVGARAVQHVDVALDVVAPDRALRERQWRG